MKKKIAFWMAVYLIGVFVTYGYAYRESIRNNKLNYPMLRPTFGSEPEAFFQSVIWPIYLPCHLSVKVWMSYEVK